MLITFHSKVVAEVLMLTDHAGILLQAAGKSFGDKIPERGVFTADQLGPAIQGIERAIEESQGSHDEDEEDEDKAPVAPMARAVGLKAVSYTHLRIIVGGSVARGTGFAASARLGDDPMKNAPAWRLGASRYQALRGITCRGPSGSAGSLP